MENMIGSKLSFREKCCLYFFQGCEYIGNATIKRLFNHFGSFEEAYSAGENELRSVLNQNTLEKMLAERSKKDIVLEYDKVRQKNIRHIYIEDDDYPEKLRGIPDAPIALLVAGSLPNPLVPSVAIIGARSCSEYGNYMAREYASALSGAGIQIISGMAAGIDGIAQTSALSAGGRSFAVLGNGPDVCYPRSNESLYRRLLLNGGIISEYCLGSSGLPWHFPVRNRIISGLSDALLVMEAKEKSGTLITVDSALEQGRDIYALPGRTCDKLSSGCNNLIRQGAGILIDPEEFLGEFLHTLSSVGAYSGFLKAKSSLVRTPLTEHKNGSELRISFSSPEEKCVYDILDFNPKSMDQIVSAVNSSIPMPLPIVLQRLTGLCMKGLVENISGTNYRRKV